LVTMNPNGLVAAGELLQPPVALQPLEQQLYLPPQGIDRPDILGWKLLHWEIGNVDVVGPRLLVQDGNEPEGTIPKPRWDLHRCQHKLCGFHLGISLVLRGRLGYRWLVPVEERTPWERKHFPVGV